MARVKRGVTKHARHKKVLDRARGYQGRGKNNFRVAIERVEKGLQYAYRDRRQRKRQFRRLWITRINAGARLNGTTYSQLMGALRKADVALNRKALADLAMHEPDAFTKVVEHVRE